MSIVRIAEMLRRLHPRPPTLVLAAIGLAVLAGGVVRAAPAAPDPATLAPPLLPPAGPRGAGESRPRMWAVSLASMVVYENGSGYLYGTWRQFGSAVEQPARLYWGRGCPDISDRVYHVLQAGYLRPQDFWLVVDREPDPRQQGAFCVRNVELEARGVAVPPPPAPPPAPVPAPAPAKPAAAAGK